MKVMFVYHNQVEDGFMPQAIGILGGMMRDNGIDTRLFDTTLYRDKGSHFIETDRKLREDQANGGYKKIKGFNPTREIVDLKEKFYEEVEKYRPDLIAATSTSFEFKSLTDFILPAKTAFGIPVIVGGSHATVAPFEAIRNPAVDYVCVGEGERPLLGLVRKLEANVDTYNIPNLVVERNGKVITNPRAPILLMDQTPDADWDLLGEIHRIRPFEGKLKNYGWFEMSRGCPHRCSYCINSALHDMKAPGEIQPGHYRFFSQDEIINRMVAKKKKYGYNHVQLIDENLTVMSQDRLEKVAEAFKENIGVGFFTQSRPENFTGKSKKAKIMAKMGCEMIAMGMESGNEELRRNVLNRPMKNGVIEEAADSLRDVGIKIAAYYIMGFPGETREMIKDTIALHKRVRPDRFSVRFLHPFPGTKIREVCINKGYLPKNFESGNLDASFFKDPILDLPSPPHPSKEELMELRQELINS